MGHSKRRILTGTADVEVVRADGTVEGQDGEVVAKPFRCGRCGKEVYPVAGDATLPMRLLHECAPPVTTGSIP